jgi:hypothetical protein
MNLLNQKGLIFINLFLTKIIKMKKLIAKSDSKVAEILMNYLERRRLVQSYINGNFSLEELNALGVEFAQPLSIKISQQ